MEKFKWGKRAIIRISFPNSMLKIQEIYVSNSSEIHMNEFNHYIPTSSQYQVYFMACFI